MANKIIHKHSSVITDGKAKIPTSSQLDYGELAVNYAAGVETITLKNTNNEIVEFKTSNYLENLIQDNKNLIDAEKTAREQDIQEVYDIIKDDEEVTASALTDLDKRIQSVEGFDMNEFATKEYVESEISGLDTSLSGLQGQIDVIKGDYLKSSDKAELNNAIAAESTARNEALKNYLTISESEKNELVVATALTDLDDRIIQLNEDLNGVNADALEDLDTRLTNLTNDFNESDEGSAAALADLDERLNNISTVIEDNEYVTALAISDLYERIDTPMLTVNSYSYTIEPNIYYKLTPKTGTLTVTFETPTNENIVNQYMFEFTSGSVACTLSLPSSVKWANGTAPSIEANKTYQVSVLNNLGCIVSFG